MCRRSKLGLGGAGVDGGLATPAGADLLAVQVNSRSANKVDYYAERTAATRCRSAAGEAIETTTEVELPNDSPPEGVPGYVIPPNMRHEPRRQRIARVSASCPAACDLSSAKRDGEGDSDRGWEENSATPGTRTSLTPRPGGETRLWTIVTRRDRGLDGELLRWHLPANHAPPDDGAPDQVQTFAIHRTSGTEVASTSTRHALEADRADLERSEPTKGPDGARRSVSRPLPLRWWRNLVRAVPLTGGVRRGRVGWETEGPGRSPGRSVTTSGAVTREVVAVRRRATNSATRPIATSANATIAAVDASPPVNAVPPPAPRRNPRPR